MPKNLHTDSATNITHHLSLQHTYKMVNKTTK